MLFAFNLHTLPLARVSKSKTKLNKVEKDGKTGS